MFLAMNNAILAGGADMGIQQTAMEQLSQAYAKGKPDMMEWRALQTAMPAQLQQIAKAMNTTTNALGENLRSGKVSMNDFMKTVVQLNEKGVYGFANFAEQARNATGGIKTAIANMKTAISRGVASIIDNINKGLEMAGLPNISKIIASIGKIFENVFTKIGNTVKVLIVVLSPLFNVIKAIYEFFVNNWSIIQPIIWGIVGAIGAYYTITTLAKVPMLAITIATKAWTAAQWLLNIALNANPIGLVVGAIVILIGIIWEVVNAIHKSKAATESAAEGTWLLYTADAAAE